MPLMPPREPRPEPLARARARLEFDALVRRRSAAIVESSPSGGHEDPAAVLAGREEADRAALVEAVARSFADAVDRENSSRGILRAGLPVEYVDAVLVEGHGGQLVVDAEEYEQAPVRVRARVGFDTGQTVIRGRDLDGYLRTGDARYAEALGLPA